jgi:putative membrane protein
MKGLLIRLSTVGAVIALAAVAANVALAGHRAHRDSWRHVSGLDIEWLKTSVQGDLFEIQGGQLALQKSTNTAVQTLAQRLITDHTQSLHESQRLAARYHIKLENKPTPTQQWQLSELSEWTAPLFDREYSELEVADHLQDITETADEIHLGFNRRFRMMARQEIPMLKMHLQLAQQALASANTE